MSAPAEAPEQEGDSETLFTVFDGSSPEDVSHARRLWSSLSLLPPLESRLVSADISQRLPVSRPQRSSTAAPGPQRPAPGPQRPAPGPQRPAPGPQRPAPGPQRPAPGPQRPAPGPQRPAPEPPSPALRQEERQRYAAMGDQRREVLALLKRQRDRRIQRERVSEAFQPKTSKKTLKPPDCDVDQELVRQLI